MGANLGTAFGANRWAARVTTDSPSEASGTPLPLPHNLAAASQAIEMELRRKPRKTMELRPDAGDALADAHADFLADLGREAIRLARNAGLGTVDRVHVEQAVGRLGMGSSSSTLGSVLLAAGGVPLGVGLTLVATMSSDGAKHSTADMYWMLAFLVPGLLLFTLGTLLTLIRTR